MFYISASIYAFGTIFYGLFGSGEIQPWAVPEIAVLDVKPSQNAEETGKLATKTTY